MNRKEESEPLLLQADNGSHLDGTDEADIENNLYTRPQGGKGGAITLQKPTAEHDYSVTGEHYDPLSRRNTEHPTSNFDTMIHLLKGNIGTGILAMPDAFKNAGLAVGTIGTVLIGLVCVHTMHLLVKCAHELCRRTQVPVLSFAEVAETSFKVGPVPLRRFSYAARALINVFLCITQMGFCCVYFVFVSNNIEKVVKSRWNYDELTSRQYMAILLFPMICLNMIRNLKLLAPFMMVANVFMGVGLGIIFYYVLQDLPSVSERRDFSSLSQLPLYFGTAIYAFEGIGMILPLENSMKHPQDFGGWNGVLNTSMVIVGCLYTAVGFFGFLKYGDDVKGSVTLNLPAGDMLAESVQLMMALSIFLSYALQFYVPIDIVWPSIKQNIPTERMQLIMEYVFRAGLVLFTFAMAAAVPDLGLFISLVGALSSSTLALIFPPIINILTNWSQGYGPYRYALFKDMVLIFIGMVGMIAGTYVSIEQILNKTSNPDDEPTVKVIGGMNALLKEDEHFPLGEHGPL